MSSVHPQHGNIVLIRHLHEDNGADCKRVLAARSRSAPAKTQRAVALLWAFIRLRKLQEDLIVPHVVATYLLRLHYEFGSTKCNMATVNHSSALCDTGFRRVGQCLDARQVVYRLMGRADVVEVFIVLL